MLRHLRILYLVVMEIQVGKSFPIIERRRLAKSGFSTTHKTRKIIVFSSGSDDESKTHLFLSQFFKYISGLKVQLDVKLWSFY